MSTPTQLTGTVEIEKTRWRIRDKHLRSADFFDVEDHPMVRFVSDSAELQGKRLKVRGELHARGDSIPLELDAQLRRVGDELQVESCTYVDQRKLGMPHSPLGMIRTPSELIVRGRLVRYSGKEG